MQSGAAMLTLEHHFTGTYAKRFLTEWPVLSDIMHEETRWQKDRLQGNALIELTEKQIDDALNGPFQTFFKLHLHAYAAIAKVDVALNFSKEETLKDLDNATEIDFGVSKLLINKTDSSTLRELREKLDQLIKEHYAQWQESIRHWIEALQSHINQQCALSDLEVGEFSINQPISELNERFIELNISTPAFSKFDGNFQQYFILKATLVIHSALSRMHQPHSEKKINDIVKKLANTLKKMHYEENLLVDSQQKKVKSLLIAIQWD